MKRNKTGLIIAICICIMALVSVPIVIASLDLGQVGYTAATVILYTVGPMLLIALLLCLFGQWKSKPYYWLPDDMAKEKMAEDAARKHRA